MTFAGRTSAGDGPAPVALIKGAGDLATGVALRLRRAGFAVVMTELDRPTVLRRRVAFAEAMYEAKVVVEGVEAVRVEEASDIWAVLDAGKIAVIRDPSAAVRRLIDPLLVVDAIMAKRNLHTRITDAPAVVALGPGFVAGRDAHAVVETNRGHTLGRVITDGEALPDTGVPGTIGGFAEERLLRAPCAGVFAGVREIGDHVVAGEVVGHVDGQELHSRLDGVLRGLVRSGLEVVTGAKVGDVDPRGIREHCFTVSDKSAAVAGGVLEAACALLGGVRFSPGRRSASRETTGCTGEHPAMTGT